MAGIVIAYGLLLATLGFVLQQVTPSLAKVTFFAGMAGGGLSVLWGIVGLMGHKRRSWAVVTLTVVALVLLSQAVHAWSLVTNGTPGSLTAAALLTFVFLSTIGALMYLLHGDRTPDFYRTGAAHGNNAVTPVNARTSDEGRHQR